MALGYYTDPAQRRANRRGGWLLPIVIGIISGVILVIVIYPSLFGVQDQRELEGNSIEGSIAEEEGKVTEQSSSINQPISVDVTTQITDIVERVSPAVVGVTNIQLRSDFWRSQGEESEAGTGSGVIYKKDDEFAYIITNQHVVEYADMIEVVLSD